MKSLETALFGTLAVWAIAAILAACSIIPLSPEAQIVQGANSITAGATAGTVLLKNDRITVGQAKSYRAILGTADAHLRAAAKDLTDCRAKTGSNAKTVPDPCKATVQSDIELALSIAADVEKTLKAKE